MPLSLFLLLVAAAPTVGLDVSIRRLVEMGKPFDGTILVARKGKRLYHKSFGLADRSFGVRVKNDTRFRIASVPKAFTAVLVMQLVDEGRLELDRPVKAYLPSFPNPAGDRITIRQLLNHTSGLPNADAETKDYEQAWTKGLDQYQRVLSLPERLARWCRGPLRSEPGTRFDYNNADYIALEAVLQELRGKPFEEVLRERILAPLGMRDSGIAVHRRLVPGLALTYFLPDGAKELENEIPILPENFGGAGAMFSTTSDLARFADALFGGRLLKPASLETMLKPGLDEYGFGMWITTVEIHGRKITVVSRPGEIMGANAELRRFRELGLTVIVLSNTNRRDLGALASEIADLVE